MRRALCVLVVAVVTVFVASVAFANDERLEFGVQASFADNDLDFGIGGRVSAPLDAVGDGFSLLGTFDLFFPDGPASYWEANGNLVYTFRLRRSRLHPYVGAGLNLGHWSSGGASDSDMGLNVLGGINIPARRLRPFVEARVELRDNGPFLISAGLRF
jgi:hypothetical protein